MSHLAEADIEQGILDQLEGLGRAVASETVIGRDGSAPARMRALVKRILRRYGYPPYT